MKEIYNGDEIFPKKLISIPNPPSRIFVEGNLNLLNSLGIAVIGTRHPSEYGRRMCRRFTKELVEYGVTIISGLANGIDSIAHNTCLDNGGKTIAVLPSGLKNIYPPKNQSLFKKILDSDNTVVTEYNEDEKADSKKFLERNRIVSGLGIGTLVVEAGYRSGTSVTARLTIEQKRKLFSIPSSLDNSKGITSNLIIQSDAKLVTCVEDILEEFSDIKFMKNEKMNLEKFIDEEYRKLYSFIGWRPQHINTLAKILNYTISDVNYKLMMLELDGYIEKLPGDFYIRK